MFTLLRCKNKRLQYPLNAALPFLRQDEENDLPPEERLLARLKISLPLHSSSLPKRGFLFVIMNLSPTPFRNGSDALHRADALVIKIGGENALRFRENIDSVRRRVASGQKIILVLSALRGNRQNGFNTTSALIALARCL